METLPSALALCAPSGVAGCHRPPGEAGAIPGPCVSKVLPSGLAHHPRGPSQGDKKGRVSSAPEAQHPAHPTPALSGPLGVTLLPSSASRARACLRPGGGACPSPHPGSGGGGGARIKFVWAPRWGTAPWILPVGGLWLRGPGAQQRGWAKRAPGGALEWWHWAGVQGGQAAGH